jgi:polysaccharide export outer membrane protein
MTLRFLRSGAAVAGLALLALVPPARAQEYVIGAEDVLQISVFQHPELERSVTVNLDGNITFPPVGELKAAGLSPKQLGDRIGDKLNAYLRQTTAVTVTVTSFMSRSITVVGAVARPGRYGFERMPSVPDAIAAAGGAIPDADLSRVEVVRREGAARRTLIADVGAALRDGVGVPLPELRPGDQVIVPGGTGLAQFSAAGTGVGVLGEVSKPGLYSVGTAQDLWTVLAVAGGLTARGDLTNVRIISRQGGAQTVAKINLRDVLNKGARGSQLVKPGDVVFVSASGSSQFGRAIGGLQTILSISRDVLNIILINEIIQNDSTSLP